MISLILTVGIICILVFALLGAFVFVKTIILPMQEPADTSNRIAHLRLVWFAITRPELFTQSFEWLKRDELDNLKN